MTSGHRVPKGGEGVSSGCWSLSRPWLLPWALHHPDLLQHLGLPSALTLHSSPLHPLMPATDPTHSLILLSWASPWLASLLYLQGISMLPPWGL